MLHTEENEQVNFPSFSQYAHSYTCEVNIQIYIMQLFLSNKKDIHDLNQSF